MICSLALQVNCAVTFKIDHKATLRKCWHTTRYNAYIKFSRSRRKISLCLHGPHTPTSSHARGLPIGKLSKKSYGYRFPSINPFQQNQIDRCQQDESTNYGSVKVDLRVRSTAPEPLGREIYRRRLNYQNTVLINEKICVLLTRLSNDFDVKSYMHEWWNPIA